MKIKIKKKVPRISFPGSACQQSYGEDVDHGYLLWNIQDKKNYDVKFCKLPNPKPFVTVQWKESVDKTLEEILKYPNGSRFRIRSEVKLAQNDTKDLTEKCIALKNASEVTFKIDYLTTENFSDALKKVETAYETSKTNLHQVESLIDLMKEYYSNVKICELEWQQISDILEKYIKSSEIDNSVVRGAKWSPKTMKFDNLYCYGENNVLDFEKLNGIVGIFGNNRVGKSSIIGALLWGLYNSSDRGKIKNYHVINTRKNYCSSTTVFSCGTSDYVIERQSVKNESKFSSDASVTSLNFFKVNEEKLDTLNGIQRTDTEKEIRKLIGSFDDFLLMSVATQDDLSKFIKHGSTNRAKILAKFLDLDVISTMYELAKTDVQNIRSKMSVIKFKNWDELIAEKENLRSQKKDKLVEIISLISSKKILIDELKVKFSNLTGDSYVSKADIISQTKKVESLNQKIEKIVSNINSIKNEIEAIDKKIGFIVETKKKYDVAKMKDALSECNSITLKLSESQQREKEEKDIFERQKDSIKILKTVPCGTTFPNCKFIKNSYKDKEKIKFQHEKLKKLSLKISQLQEKLDSNEYKNLSQDIDKLEKVFSAEIALEKENVWKNKELILLNDSLETIRAELKIENERLLRLESLKKKSNINEVDLVQSEIDALSKELQQLDSKKTSVAVDCGKLDSEIKILKAEESFYSENKKVLRVYELILNSFSKKGIPNRIIAKSLPRINSEIENVLHGIVEFTVELEIDEDGNDLEVYIDYGDSKRIAELGSGMEKMISTIAIRTALYNISSLPKSDIFIIDEGFGSLDESGLEAVNRLLVGLKKFFKTILVISHIDTVKDVTDSIIEISRMEKNSRITF